MSQRRHLLRRQLLQQPFGQQYLHLQQIVGLLQSLPLGQKAQCQSHLLH
jgi:hypothetical protein